jgi:hypothetical protein
MSTNHTLSSWVERERAEKERLARHMREERWRRWRVTIGAAALGLAVLGALVAFLALSATGGAR